MNKVIGTEDRTSSRLILYLIIIIFIIINIIFTLSIDSCNSHCFLFCMNHKDTLETNCISLDQINLVSYYYFRVILLVNLLFKFTFTGAQK